MTTPNPNPALRAAFLGLALFLAAILLAARAEASRLVRVAPGDDIAALIAELPDNMVILMAPGTYRLSLVLAGRRLIFMAPEGAVVEAGDQGFAFWMQHGAEIAMDGLDIRGAPGRQPAVVVKGATLRLKDVVIDSPDKRALYIDGMLEAEGGRIVSGGGAALFVAGGGGATLRRVEVASEAGIAVAAQNARRLVIEGARLSGRTALRAVAVSDGVTVANSLLEGRGESGAALVLEDVTGLSLADSVLLASGPALSGTIGTGHAWQVGGSLLASRGGGAVDITGLREADLRFEVSAAIALSGAEDGHAFLSEGTGFIPLIGDSLLLARSGSALKVQNGAGALVARSLLAGGSGPLRLADHDPQITSIGDSLLTPDARQDAQVLALMDRASRRLSGADPALTQQVAQNFLSELAGAQAQTPDDPAAMLAALEATFIDMGELRAELAQPGDGLAHGATGRATR